jgi:hypothetical protein
MTNKKTYTIEMIEHEDGGTQLIRTNDGFDAFELLGLLELAQLEIIEQIKGNIKPDIIKRNIVEDKS